MKPLLTIGVILGQAAIVLLAFRAGEARSAAHRNASPWESYTRQIPRGVALNPVPLNVGNRNAGAIIQGSYLVNAVQHCNFCHTCPPYASDLDSVAPGFLPPVNAVNYLAGGKRFGAPNDPEAPISANLTPGLKTGLPGGLTFSEFVTALRTGRAHKTGRSLRVMPWPMFNDLTDTDLMSIYEYLGSIPHAEPGPEYPPGTGPHTEQLPAKP